MKCVDCHDSSFGFDTCFGKSECNDGIPSYEFLKKENARLKRNLTRRMGQAAFERTIELQRQAIERDIFEKEYHNEIKRRMKAFADKCAASLDPCA